MVPLNEAWESGAQSWNSATRIAFANDLSFTESLIAVSAASNRSKGDRDPNNWMPKSSVFRCNYIVNWISVKYRWSLTVDASEKSFLSDSLKNCAVNSSVKIPKRFKIVFKQQVAEPSPSTTPTSSQTPTAAPSPPESSSGNDPRYSTCTAAKAAGYGPYRNGLDPEYSWYVDRDNDGVVCE